MIDKNKEYKTKCGYPVRIYSTGGNGIFPVHGAFLDSGGDWRVHEWTSQGIVLYQWDRNNPNYLLQPLDLVEVKPKRKVAVYVYLVTSANYSYCQGGHVVENYEEGELFTSTFPLLPNTCIKLIDTIEKEYDL